MKLPIGRVVRGWQLPAGIAFIIVVAAIAPTAVELETIRGVREQFYLEARTIVTQYPCPFERSPEGPSTCQS